MKEGEGVCVIGKLVVQMRRLCKRCYDDRGSLGLPFAGAGVGSVVNIHADTSMSLSLKVFKAG